HRTNCDGKAPLPEAEPRVPRPRLARVRHHAAVTEGDQFADDLRENRAYAKTFSLAADLDGRAVRRLAVLTCIDSRIDPLAMPGLESGRAEIVRHACARGNG